MIQKQVRRSAELATLIEEEIESLGHPLGYNLGSESALCERYEVSRAVFREAARLLEHHQLAKTKTGRGGGLIVSEPGIGNVSASVALLLRRKGVGASDLAEARLSVEVTGVRLATEHIGESGITALRECLEYEETAPVSAVRGHAADFHLLVARLSGNSVLELFTEMLIDLTLQRIDDPQEPHIANATRLHAHHKIAEAIIAGDAALAQHRMNRHLDGMARSWATSKPNFQRLSASTFVPLDFERPNGEDTWASPRRGDTPP